MLDIPDKRDNLVLIEYNGFPFWAGQARNRGGTGGGRKVGGSFRLAVIGNLFCFPLPEKVCDKYIGYFSAGWLDYALIGFSP